MGDDAPAVVDPAKTLLPGKAGSDSKDSGGLRRIASAAREGSARGPYKCKRCGKRHGEGIACSGASDTPAPRAARAPSAPAQPASPLFNEANTARLVRMPFAIAAIRTHCADLALDDKQEKELSVSGAVVLNEWVSVDPKYVALCLFAISLAGVAFEKVLVYSMYVKLQQIELEREKLRAAANNPARRDTTMPEAPPASAPAAPFAAREEIPQPRTT